MQRALRRRRAPGFTLIELLITVMLSMIIFAGLAAIYGQAFREQTSSIREELLQASATMAIMKMQRDFKEATYIVSPTVGSFQNQQLQGYKNYVYTGPNANDFSAVPPGATPVTFFYQVCSNGQLYYYEQNFPFSGAPNTGCAAWGSLTMPLVETPIKVEQNGANPIFQRTAAVSGGFETLTVNFVVYYPPTVNGNNIYGIAVPSMTVTTLLPVNASYLSP